MAGFGASPEGRGTGTMQGVEGAWTLGPGETSASCLGLEGLLLKACLGQPVPPLIFHVKCCGDSLRPV